MEFKTIYFLLVLILISGCSKRITLENELSCSKFSLSPVGTVRSDMKNNFEIQVPNNWKHKLYYDDYQSSIFMADTIKQLTETYIIDAAWKFGELNFNTTFEASLNQKNNLTIVTSNFEDFKGYDSYWNISKGKKNNFTYHLFNLFIKTAQANYLEIKIDIYGKELVDERLCEALSLIGNITILN